MKKVVPFQKDITFKTNLAEVTSISLEHNLHASGDNMVTGEFIVSGDYKIADSSTNIEQFDFHIPFDINLDVHYDLKDIVVDIDDFYYEIVNNNILLVHIDVLIDKLKDKPLIEPPIVENVSDIESEMEEVREVMEEREDEKMDDMVKETSFETSELDEVVKNSEVIEDISFGSETVSRETNQEATEQIKSLFDSMDDSSETYVTYKVYIVREGDTVESVMQKYSITYDVLEAYNDMKELKIGDKLIIPASMNV